MKDYIEHTKSSGNVYEDLGFKDAKERLVKAELAAKINEIIEYRHLTQKQAGVILGINQPKVSALINGRLVDFSIERLIFFLNKLDQDVKIVISGKPKKRKTPAKFMVAFA